MHEAFKSGLDTVCLLAVLPIQPLQSAELAAKMLFAYLWSCVKFFKIPFQALMQRSVRHNGSVPFCVTAHSVLLNVFLQQELTAFCHNAP